jgi:thioesterase domain-containing protein
MKNYYRWKHVRRRKVVSADATNGSLLAHNTTKNKLGLFLSLMRRSAIGLALGVLAAILLNWALHAWGAAIVDSQLSMDATVRLVHVASASEPLQVRCEVHGPRRTGTLFVIPGAGATWLVNSLPLWSLPILLEGVELCSYARPGAPLAAGMQLDSDAAGASQLVAQVVELIEHVTNASLPLWIAGHSYGCVVAPVVAKRLRKAGRTTLAGVLLIDGPPLFREALHRQEEFVRIIADKLVPSLRWLERASTLGVLRATQAFWARQIENHLRVVPQRYHSALVHALLTRQVWTALIADAMRVNASIALLRAELPLSASERLLGAIPVDVVDADAATRHIEDPMPAPELLELERAGETDSLYASLSHHYARSVIANADHLFHTSDEIQSRLMQRLVSILRQRLH